VSERDRRAAGLSRGKKLLFSVVPVSAVCLLLLFLEAGLRLFSPSTASHLLGSVSYDGREWTQINRSSLAKYFPASSPLIPEIKPSLVTPRREPGSIRILCLGESSMFGTPYEMNATIPAMLRKQLRHLYPGRTVEVINLGASAINTNVILDMAPAMLDLHPDLVLVYTGHNEFYGPDGVGASWLEREFPSLTGVKYGLRDLRTIRWIQAAMRSYSLAKKQGGEQNLMKQVSGEAHVALESDDARRIFGNFEHNLAAIIGTFRSRGIPVVVSDISSNLLFPPFASPPLAGEDHIDSLIAGGSAAAAAGLLLSGRPGDSSNAAREYRLGLCALAEGDSIDAALYLGRARDLDLLKFRAPGRINLIIHDVCTRLAVPCIASDSALRAASPHGITGPTLFWEHLHPKVEGYFHIAGLFLDAVTPLLPARVPSARPLLFDLDSLSVPWLDLAFADISIRGLTLRWPFENYRVSPAVLPQADSALQHIALSVHQRVLGWNEACLQTAAYFTAHGDVRRAATTYEALLEEYPGAYLTRYLLALLLRDAGRLAEAMDQYRRCIATNPSYPYPRVDLGLLLVNAGRLDSAEVQFRSALDLADRQASPATLIATAHYGLAAVAANRGRYDEAIREADDALRRLPSYRAPLELRERIRRTLPPSPPR